MNNITKDDLSNYIKNKNCELEVRSLECMSHADARYKKYKLEISVEDCKIVYDPDFWPYGTKKTLFRKRNVADREPSRRNDSETGD